MRVNNKYYTGNEYHLRLGIYLSNKRFVEEFNKNKNRLHTLALNQFASYTPSEFKSLLGVIPQQSSIKTRQPIVSTKNDPESLDWREKGAVNPVRNQADCGACWAFSSIAAAEERAFGYVINDQGRRFQLESDCPYVAVQQDCKFDASKGVGDISSVTVYRGEQYIQPNLVKWGPTSVCVDASGAQFMLYSGGIYDGSDCDTYQNHAVCIVGYGSENDVPYWIVRNSWGPSWGEEGYIRMLKNVNVCGISATITGIEI